MYFIGIIVFTKIHEASSLELLSNCTEDFEGRWFTCLKFVGKMNSPKCTKTCSLNNWSHFSLTDFYNYSDGLQFFLKKLNLTGLEYQTIKPDHISEWSILEYAGTLNS